MPNFWKSIVPTIDTPWMPDQHQRSAPEIEIHHVDNYPEIKSI